MSKSVGITSQFTPSNKKPVANDALTLLTLVEEAEKTSWTFPESFVAYLRRRVVVEERILSYPQLEEQEEVGSHRHLPEEEGVQMPHHHHPVEAGVQI